MSQQTFRRGDKVEWQKTALPGYGNGPFKVLKVTPAQPHCPHVGRRAHWDIHFCPTPHPPPHPQLVAIARWDSDALLTTLSGIHLKKSR